MVNVSNMLNYSILYSTPVITEHGEQDNNCLKLLALNRSDAF